MLCFMRTLNAIPANISTLDQRYFNVVDPTLKVKQNPLDFQHWTTLIQRQCPTLKQRRNNVAQRCINFVVSTLVIKPG